jgi:hypothetical protein
LPFAAQDIIHFLLSRYSLEINEDVVKDEILAQLAGDPEEEPKHIMDLRQMVGLLLISHLAKVATEDDKKEHVEQVLREITSDLQTNGIEELVLSKKLIMKLLDGYGESNVPDDLIDEMLDVAGGDGAILNSESFLRALTSDITQYDNTWETKLSTHYSDVLEDAEIAVGRPDSMLREVSLLAGKKAPADDFDDMEVSKIDGALKEKTNKVLSFSGIDHIADTYRSQTFAIIIWAALVAFYVAYVYSNTTGDLAVDCDTFSSAFGCKVVNAIGSWYAIFAKISVLGGSFIFLGSSGNSIFASNRLLSIVSLLFGMAVVALFTVVPYWATWENWFFNTNFLTQNVVFELFNVIALVFGALLLLIQLCALIRLIIPTDPLRKADRLRILLTPGMASKESNTKRAAVFKTNKMVENALDLHLNESQLATHRRGNGQAMSNFQTRSHMREKVGGVIWGWRQFFNSRICNEDGVWFHTRLLASALAQVSLILMLMSLVFVAVQEVLAMFDRANDDDVADGAMNGTGTDVIREVIRNSLIDSFGNVSSVLNEQNVDQFYDDLNVLVYEKPGINLTTADLLTGALDDPYSAFEDWLVENVEPWEALFAIGFGAFFGFAGVIMIVLVYIPSFISNVLQFRAGLISSPYDSRFELYRKNTDTTTAVFGTAFWDDAFTAFFGLLIPGGVAFLLVWSQTRSFVTGIVAQLIGIVVTMSVKIL